TTTKRVTVIKKLATAKTPCQKTLPAEFSSVYCATWRGESLSAISRSRSTTEVSNTEKASSIPTIPIMPIVSARPCQNARAVVCQILFSARSMTAKTHEPAQSVTIKHVMRAPVPTEDIERIVSRRNLPEPGYTSTAWLGG